MPKLLPHQFLAIARASYNILREYAHALGEPPKPTWEELSPAKQADIVVAVTSVVRMHVTPEEQHARWLQKKLADGWTYGPRRDPETKQHPAVRLYAELAPEQRAKGIICRAVCYSIAGMLAKVPG